MSRTLLKIIRLIKPYKWWILLSIFIAFLTVGSSIGLLMTSAFIIAKAALHPSIAELQVGIVGVRFFGITRGVFRYIERLISHETTFKLLAKFRSWFFQSIEPLVPSKTGEYSSGDLLTRVVSDVESLEHVFIRVISPPFVAIMVAILVVVLFANYSISIAVAFLIPYLFAGIGVPYITHKLSKKFGENIVLLRSRLTELTLDGIDGKNELLSFGKVDNHKIEFDEINQKLVKTQRKIKLIDGMNESLIQLLMNIAIVMVFVQAAPYVSNAIFDGISLSVLSLGTLAAFEAVFPIPLAVNYLTSSIKAGERLFQITDRKMKKKEGQHYNLIGDSLKLNKVGFEYKEDEKVLDEISLKIQAKEKIAIIGGTGAGKSTISNILLNLWKINSGSIEIDNIKYEVLDDNLIREKFSVIPQKIFLFSDTIKNNLLIAKPNATDDEIWEALRMAELKNFVDSLPNKLETWIGNQGKQISGGERKRLAIARAILKDAPIFICDEITSDLDSINELNIINTIHEITKNKSLIFITHRLVDMEKFDTIYLLGNGKIIANGTHEHLFECSEKYRGYFLKN